MKNIFSILIILLGFSLEIYGQVDNPPVISDISNIPAIPEEDEDLVISATITDDGGLTATDLYYVINSGETQITTMTNIVGTNMFSVTLSSSVYNKGDLFEYWIHAADNGPFAPQITESAHTDFLIGTIDIISIRNSSETDF